MRTTAVLVSLLTCCLVHMAAGRLIFPRDDSPAASAGRCRTSTGAAGLCVTLSSRRCSLFPSAAHIVALRPRLCSFSPTDPVVCCPTNEVRGSGRPPPATTRRDERRTTMRRVPTRQPTRPVTKITTTGTTIRSESSLPGARRTPMKTVRTTAKPAGSLSSRSPQSSPRPTIDTTATTRRRKLVGLPSRPPAVPPSPPSRSRSSLSRPSSLPGCGTATPLTLFRAGGQYFLRPPVLGGSVAVQVATQPWTVLVGFVNGTAAAAGRGGEWICAGALLSSRLVVTAARCVVLGGSPQRLVVGLGDHDLATSSDGTGGVIGVAAFQRHPEYAQPSRRHDLALLLLRRAAPHSPLVRHVCLPPADPPPTEEEEYDDEYYLEDDASDDTEQEQMPPVVGTPLLVTAYDLDALWTVKQGGRGRLQTNITSVAPLAICNTSLATAPLAGFLYPRGLRPQTELCLPPSTTPAATADWLCRADVGAPVVARGAGDVAQLEALHMLDGCGAGGVRPQVALRLRHYVPWILETMDSLLATPGRTGRRL